jgi:hypothetical protein
MILKFQISDPIWWGYNIDINLDNYYNLDNIIEYILDNLNVTLRSLNLLPQAEFLEKVKKDFHIHNYRFEDILTFKENETVYICRHPANTDNEDLKLH